MDLSLLDCVKMYLVFLLAGFSLDLTHTFWRSFQMQRVKRSRRRGRLERYDMPEAIPPSNEVLESHLDQQAEIMARAMKILNRQIRDKTDGEIDLDFPPPGD